MLMFLSSSSSLLLDTTVINQLRLGFGDLLSTKRAYARFYMYGNLFISPNELSSILTLLLPFACLKR